MNPNYPTLRTVSETTYYFLSNTCLYNFKWVLQNIYHANDFSTYGKNNFPIVIPENIKIPTVTTSPQINHIAKQTCVLISHYDTNDLHQILCDTFDNVFEELETKRKIESEEAYQEYLQNESIRKKHHII